MDGEEFMADHIVASWEVARDRRRPGGVVSDEFAHSPFSTADRAAQETSFVDLEPVEVGGSRTCA